MGIGYELFKLLGVCADWVFGNLWRTLRRKPRKSWTRIWNGDSEKIKDDLDGCGYELFYLMLGGIVIVVVIWIINL